MSQLFFVLIILCGLYLGYLAKGHKKSSLLFVMALIALLTFAAGFRGMECGVDTPSYYDNIINGFPFHWVFREEGFRFIANFFVERFSNPQLMFVFCAFVTNTLIIMRLWDFREKADFGFLVLLYELLFYPNSMNIMRQYVAIALIFYGSRFLKTKMLYFMPFIVAAFFFHRSSLLSFGFVALSLWGGFSKKQKKLFFLPLLFLVVGSFVYVGYYLLSDVAAYSSQKVDNFNITYIYLVFITLTAVVFYKRKIRVKILAKRALTNYAILDNTIILYVLVGLAFEALSMQFEFVGRVGLYYSIYYIPFWGIASTKLANRECNKLMIMVYAIYCFLLIVLRNDALIFPYSIFFY